VQRIFWPGVAGNALLSAIPSLGRIDLGICQNGSISLDRSGR